mgnify:CR=1 FL=1
MQLKMTIKTNGKLLELSTPIVMGIVNVTPDSFYGKSRALSGQEVVEAVGKIIGHGGTIVDIGGYSTRPDAEIISAGEELKRLSFGLEIIRKHFPDVIISVDTFRADVARQVVEEFGVSIINDIGGGGLDDKMFDTVARLEVAYILMHSKGDPQTMQKLTDYDDITAELLAFFSQRLSALKKAGVNDVIIDPGFGFAKTTAQNFRLLNNLSVFKETGAPVLAGLSRKSMIYKTLEITPDEALNGTTALNMIALENGADILRVHDVKEAVQAVNLYRQLKREDI